MARRISRIAVTIGLLVCGLLVGFFAVAIWVVRAMEYVPSPEQIQSRSPVRPFLVEQSDIVGIYANMDVDSAVFRYTTGVEEDEFWRRVEEQTRDTSWRAIAPDGNVRRYQRIISPKGQQVSWSVEEVRVRYQLDFCKFKL